MFLFLLWYLWVITYNSVATTQVYRQQTKLTRVPRPDKHVKVGFLANEEEALQPSCRLLLTTLSVNF